jgi:hypothetical protein
MKLFYIICAILIALLIFDMHHSSKRKSSDIHFEITTTVTKGES